jgi:hypothetical protein
MPRASQVIPTTNAGPRLRDDDLRTACVECRVTQTLNEATVDEPDPLTTIYRCPNGCVTPILFVTRPDNVPWTDRGYRLQGWMIRNPSDLLVHEPSRDTPSLIFPASPRALHPSAPEQASQLR